MDSYQFQGGFRRGPQSARALLQQNCATPDVNRVRIEPSTDVARALYQSDFRRGILSREVVSSGEPGYPSSEDSYMRFFLSTEPLYL